MLSNWTEIIMHTKSTIGIGPWWVVVIVVGEVDVGIGPISRLHKLVSHMHSSTTMSEPWYLCSVHPIESPSFGLQSRLHRIVLVSFDSVPRINDDRKFWSQLYVRIYIMYDVLHIILSLHTFFRLAYEPIFFRAKDIIPPSSVVPCNTTILRAIMWVRLALIPVNVVYDAIIAPVPIVCY